MGSGSGKDSLGLVPVGGLQARRPKSPGVAGCVDSLGGDQPRKDDQAGSLLSSAVGKLNRLQAITLRVDCEAQRDMHRPAAFDRRMRVLGVAEVRVDFDAINAAGASAFLLAAFGSVRLWFEIGSIAA